jgi:hypothetical protein
VAVRVIVQIYVDPLLQSLSERVLLARSPVPSLPTGIAYASRNGTKPAVIELKSTKQRTRRQSARLAISENAMASFEHFKTKYDSVFRIMQSEGVGVKNLHLEAGRLFLKAVAPSFAAANKVRTEIKRVNPNGDDITADFAVEASMRQQRSA